MLSRTTGARDTSLYYATRAASCPYSHTKKTRDSPESVKLARVERSGNYSTCTSPRASNVAAGVCKYKGQGRSDRSPSVRDPRIDDETFAERGRQRGEEGSMQLREKQRDLSTRGFSIPTLSVVRYHLRQRFFQRQTQSSGPEKCSAPDLRREGARPQSLPVGGGVSRAPHSSACTTFVYPEARSFLVERFRIPRSELLA